MSSTGDCEICSHNTSSIHSLIASILQRYSYPEELIDELLLGEVNPLFLVSAPTPGDCCCNLGVDRVGDLFKMSL